MRSYKIKLKISFKFLIVVLGFLFCASNSANGAGASLYLSPDSGTYQIGNTFSVAVKVNSGGTAANAAEGTLNFNNNELEVVRISKTGSIFSLWTNEPTFSNSVGNVVFGGGSPTAFNGTSGTIITITFRAKIAASTNVTFSSGSILAADGRGTNILTSMSSGIYKLQPEIIISRPPVEEEYVPPFTFGVPAAPAISSLTHPNPEEWYSNNSPKFIWPVPEGIIGLKLSCNEYPQTAPTVFYSSLISEKQLEELADGIWYFHCQFENEYGWGGISHLKFKIDTESPKSFEIEAKGGKETTNPRPILLFNTSDSLSGIEFYEVKIGDALPEEIINEHIKENPYQMPVQAPGKHTVIVKAVDGAGNYSLAMTEINILPIEAPTITDWPEELSPDILLSLKGTAIPLCKINIYIQNKEGEVFLEKAESNKQGDWYFIHNQPLIKGTYSIWSETIDSQGARSNSSERVKISVIPSSFVKIGEFEIGYLATMIILIALILILISVSLLVRKSIKEKREKLKKEAREAKKALNIAFEELRKVTKQQLDKLEEAKTKRELTQEEEKTRKMLKDNINSAEKFIKKEIQDIISLLDK